MSGTEAARAWWEGIVRDQRASGQTIVAFCAERGIAASSFYPWKRRLADAGEGGAAVFVEATIGGGSGDGDLRLG